MSTSYTELIQNLTRQDERRDREEMSRESEPAPREVVSGAASALLRNSGELDYEVTPTPAYLSDQNLEVQGCQFIDSTNYFLDYLDTIGRRDAEERRREALERGANVIPKPAVPCTPEVRHLILAIVGLSGGDYLNFTPITQKQIAARLGIKDLKTVRERLHQLYEWEQQNDRACVQYEERGREEGGVKYETTLYRPVVVFYAAEFIRRLKAAGLRPVHQQHAMNGRTERLIGNVVEDAEDEIQRQSVAEGLAGEMPNASGKRREQRERSERATQRSMTFLEERESKVVLSVRAWAKALKEAGYDPMEHSAELYLKVDAAVKSVAEAKVQNW